jgi:hypothetical protein
MGDSSGKAATNLRLLKSPLPNQPLSPPPPQAVLAPSGSPRAQDPSLAAMQTAPDIGGESLGLHVVFFNTFRFVYFCIVVAFFFFFVRGFCFVLSFRHNPATICVGNELSRPDSYTEPFSEFNRD